MYGRSAAIYDLLYTGTGIKDYVAEAAAIHSIVWEAVPQARTLLDVACGTGAHLRELRRWYDVEGVDMSPAMLAVARRRLRNIPLHQGDMRTLDLGRRFDAVTCLFSSIGYITDVPTLRATIARLVAHVDRPGVLVLDGWVRPEDWRTDGQPRPDVASGRETTVIRLTVSRRNENITDLEMHHLVRHGTAVDYFVEEHRLALMPTDVYVGAMRDAGLTARVIPDFMPGRDRVVGVSAS